MKNKPTTMLIDEYKQSIIEATNNSNLPPFLMEYVLKELLNEISLIARKNAEYDREAYLKEDGENGEDSE